METLIVCVPMHPALSPVTVYVVGTPGETLTVDVVALPALALQVYEVAPLALSTVLWPAHTAVGVAVTLTEGAVPTDTAMVCVEVQLPLAPVTVYVVLTAGDTLTVAEVALPAFALQV